MNNRARQHRPDRHSSLYPSGTPGTCLVLRVSLSFLLSWNLYIWNNKETNGCMSPNQNRDDSFLREWTIPEEDQAKYTSQPWNGEYRRFRSPNVACLEQYRRIRKPDTQGPHR
jgi:hypothetical protein